MKMGVSSGVIKKLRIRLELNGEDQSNMDKGCTY